jgi:hypothetical protein
MRSQVQVLAGPPSIPPGHSAAGNEPGTPAASLGRAGAALPIPASTPIGPPGPPTRAAGPTTTTHRGRHPAPDGSHAAGAATSRRNPSRATAPRSDGALRTPAWPAWSLSGHAPPPYQPGRVRHRRPADQHASSPAPPASRPAGPSTEPPDVAAAHRDSTRSRGGGCPPPRLGPTPPPGMGGGGRVPSGPTGRTPDGWTPDGWTPDGWTPDGRTAGPPDGWTPGDRTLDGLDTGRAGHRTAGPPDPGRRYRMGGHPMLDTDRRPMPWLASWHCRPGRRRLTAGCWLDAPPGRRRLGEQQPTTAQQ